MSVTIADLKSFGRAAGGGDQKTFEGLRAAVVKAEEVKENEYGTMQRAQLKDETGAWFFSAMNCPPLNRGEVIVASGRVKGNDGGKNAYFNITGFLPAGNAPPPAQQRSQPAAGGGQQAPQQRSRMTLEQRARLLRQQFARHAKDIREEVAAYSDETSARATVLEPRVVIQLMQWATSDAIAAANGEIEWGPPYYQDDGAGGDDGIPF